MAIPEVFQIPRGNCCSVDQGVCVCAHLYVYVCFSAGVKVCVHVCVYVWANVCVCVFICLCVGEGMCVCVLDLNVDRPDFPSVVLLYPELPVFGWVHTLQQLVHRLHGLETQEHHSATLVCVRVSACVYGWECVFVRAGVSTLLTDRSATHTLVKHVRLVP